MATFERSDRLKELFKEEVILALRGVKDPGLTGFLTVTDLDLSKDRKTATVFYSILGSDLEKENAKKALERAAPYMRQVIRKRVKLKTIPNITFVYDDTPKKASVIDKLLLKIEKDK